MLQIQFHIPLSHLDLQQTVASILSPDSNLEMDLQKTQLKSFLKEKTPASRIQLVQAIESDLVARYGSEFRMGFNERNFAEGLDAADIADRFTELSLKIYSFRCYRQLSDKESRDLRNFEISLDQNANELRAEGISKVVAQAVAPTAGLVHTLHMKTSEMRLSQCASNSASGCQEFYRLLDVIIR